MSDHPEVTGRCLCGAVRFSVRPQTLDGGICHCAMCRRWSAGPFMALECGGDAVSIFGEANLAVYRSSEWAERVFCKTCGSVMFWRLQDCSHYAVSLGALDSCDGVTLASQIFIDEKPPYYEFANKTKMMTGDEFTAMITGAANKD